MGVRVLGDTKRAAMYDGTSERAFGPVYRGHGNAKRELEEFLNWLPRSADSYREKDLSTLMTAYKVEKGFLDASDWTGSIEKSEELLGRDISPHG